MYDRKIAEALLDTGSIQINVQYPFTFASGITSPIYCDNRKLLGFPLVRDLIIDSFLEGDWTEVDVIVGTATAAIPWAAILADRLKKPLTYVRSTPKTYGTLQAIEGADVTGKKVLVIEDLISTGSSSKKVINTLLGAKSFVLGIFAIFSYEFLESEQHLSSMRCQTLLTFDTLLQVAEEKKYLTKNEKEVVGTWKHSPRTWQH